MRRVARRACRRLRAAGGATGTAPRIPRTAVPTSGASVQTVRSPGIARRGCGCAGRCAGDLVLADALGSRTKRQRRRAGISAAGRVRGLPRRTAIGAGVFRGEIRSAGPGARRRAGRERLPRPPSGFDAPRHFRARPPPFTRPSEGKATSAETAGRSREPAGVRTSPPESMPTRRRSQPRTHRRSEIAPFRPLDPRRDTPAGTRPAPAPGPRRAERCSVRRPSAVSRMIAIT